MRRRHVLILGLAAATGSWPGASWAQGKYPERPVRLVVPFPPGGETDLVGRLWAQGVMPHLGGTIVVENKAGAAGVIGSTEVARARADGYTLLSGQTTTHVINPIAMSKPPYDPLKDFTPIGVVSTTPTAILVNPSVPARNLQELAALAKANPGKYSFGSAGSGTITNLTGELFKIQAGGLDILHVPYKGGAPAIQDVIAGHIPMATLILSSTMLAHHRDGKLRILAVNSDERVRAAPDIPTSIESGLAGMRVQVFNAIFAPAGTPKEIVEALHQATLKAKGEALLRDGLEKAGAELADSSPERAARFIRDEVARWTPIVKASGFKIE